MFLIHSSSICYIWVGKGSIGDEKQAANEAAVLICRHPNVELVMEGVESNG